MPKITDGAGMSYEDKVMKLRRGIEALSDDYDFILIDGTPSLNLSTLNVVSACDMVFVPTPAAMLDYASTLQFTGLLKETMESYLENGITPNIPDIRFFITKYSGKGFPEYMGETIRDVFNRERGDVLTNVCFDSAEIGKAASSTLTIYEQSPSDADNSKKLKQTIEQFDALYKEMHDAIWDTCYATRNDEYVNELNNLKKQESKTEVVVEETHE